MSKRILVIEDSPTQAEELKLHYENKGFRVELAEDGEVALAILDKLADQELHYPDLIVLDYLLPGENGIEICRKLKTRTEFRSIPVLMYSLEERLSDVIAAYDAGADYYVAKESTGHQLLDLLIDAVLMRLRLMAGGVTKPLSANGIFSENMLAR